MQCRRAGSKPLTFHDAHADGRWSTRGYELQSLATRATRPAALSLNLDIVPVTAYGTAQVRSASQSVIQPVVPACNSRYIRKSFTVEHSGLREYHQALSMSEYDSQQWGEGGRYIARVMPCSPAPEHPFAYATPLADCDLASALAQARPLNTALIVASLFEAVQACHRMGIYHGDLKPANVLMYGDNPRLTDFGLAGSSRSFSARLSGSKGYRYLWNVAYAPGLAEAADLWSLGAIIMEVISRERLFSTSEIKRLADERTTAYDLLCFLRHKKALGLALVVTRSLVPSAIPTMLDALQKLIASASPPAEQKEGMKLTNKPLDSTLGALQTLTASVNPPVKHEEKSVNLATKRKIDSTTATHCDEPVAAKRSKCMRKHARRKAAKQRSAFGS